MEAVVGWRAVLAAQAPKWRLPDAFAFIDEVPKTSTGKFDKKRLREWLHDGKLLRQPGMASSPTARTEHLDEFCRDGGHDAVEAERLA